MSPRPRADGSVLTRPATRRRWLDLGWRSTAALALGAVPALARAGRQIEEPLADSVRTALSASIASSAPPVPEFTSEQARQQHERWLQTMGHRLERRFPQEQIRREFLQAVWYEARRAGLDLALGRYNGSRGQAPYPQAVLAASRQWTP